MAAPKKIAKKVAAAPLRVDVLHAAYLEQQRKLEELAQRIDNQSKILDAQERRFDEALSNQRVRIDRAEQRANAAMLPSMVLGGQAATAADAIEDALRARIAKHEANELALGKIIDEATDTIRDLEDKVRELEAKLAESPRDGTLSSQFARWARVRPGINDAFRGRVMQLLLRVERLSPRAHHWLAGFDSWTGCDDVKVQTRWQSPGGGTFLLTVIDTGDNVEVESAYLHRGSAHVQGVAGVKEAFAWLTEFFEVPQTKKTSPT